MTVMSLEKQQIADATESMLHVYRKSLLWRVRSRIWHHVRPLAAAWSRFSEAVVWRLFGSRDAWTPLAQHAYRWRDRQWWRWGEPARGCGCLRCAPPREGAR